MPKTKHKATKEEVMTFGMTCKNRTELFNKKQYFYKYAIENGFIDEIQFINPSKPRQKITIELIIETASKCKNKSELFKNYQTIYNKAKKLKMLNELKFNNLESTAKYIYENIDTLSRDDIKTKLSKHMKVEF